MTRRDVLLKALASTPSDVDRVVKRIDTSDEESLLFVLNQMVDCETHYRVQLQRVIREESPTIPALRSRGAGRESDAPLGESVDRFTGAREQTLALLKELTPGDWQRKAIHETLGETTLRFLVQSLVDCDTRHLSQLVEARQGPGVFSSSVRETAPPLRGKNPKLDSEVKSERKRSRKWPRKRTRGGN